MNALGAKVRALPRMLKAFFGKVIYHSRLHLFGYSPSCQEGVEDKRAMTLKTALQSEILRGQITTKQALLDRADPWAGNHEKWA